MPATLEIGSLVRDRYLIQQVLQQANFERLYLAEDRSLSNESYLLKEFIGRDAGMAASAGENFRAELSSLVGLQDSQLQPLKDFFWEGDRLYIVQGYVEGQTYQQWLRSRPPLAESEAVHLLTQILPVLSYLHARQVTHRDISPSNLILRNSDNLPVLTNFGVARDIKARMGIETTEPRLIDEVKNLPVGFIPAGFAEDLYALALTVIILLTGQDIPALFDASSQTWDWENWKLLSDRLTQILNRMLAVQATDRFSSAGEILQALISPSPATVSVPPTFVPPPPVPAANPYAPPPNQPYPNYAEVGAGQAEKPGKNKTWLFAFGGGILLTLVGVLAVVAVKGLPGSNSNVAATDSSRAIAPATTANVPAPTATPTRELLTQQEAANLVDRYLQAKSQMFSPPYNRQLAASLMTGKAYQDVLGSNGTIDWLQQNNAYYRYGRQSATPTGYFNTSEERAEIEVRINEEYALYLNGVLDSSKDYSDLYRFALAKENGSWKIADRRQVK